MYTHPLHIGVVTFLGLDAFPEPGDKLAPYIPLRLPDTPLLARSPSANNHRGSRQASVEVNRPRSSLIVALALENASRRIECCTVIVAFIVLSPHCEFLAV